MISTRKPVRRGALVRGFIACFVATLAGCAAATPRSPGHEAPSTQRAEPPPAPSAQPFGLDEPTAREAARALTMGSAPEDCDCDGVPDSLDVRAGRASDINHNGQDDYCDDDTEVRRIAWAELAAARDTATFFVQHQCEHEVWIHYKVPHGGANVRLTASAPSGKIVRSLLRRHVDPGAYDLVWDETDDHGAPLADGVPYSIRLEMGRRVYVRAAFWRRTS